MFRNLPCGVASLNPAFNNNDKNDGDDRLYSVTQRYGYQESPSKETTKRQVKVPARYKNAKMTVRLRPRQVLCSKCRGICNENSENVDNSRKRKVSEEDNNKQPTKRLGMQTRLSKPLISDSQNNEQQKMCLPLRLPNMQKEQNGHEKDEDDSNDYSHDYNEVSQSCSDPGTFLANSIFSSQQKLIDLCFVGTIPPSKSISRTKSMVLRKKHSVGSMEDLWDESVFEETNLGDLSHNTRTIKISFGREGEGTILKIPAKIDDLVDADKERTSAKAARRALKKAKKEARRKILLGSGGSPCYTLAGNSPRYSTLGGNSPRCTVSGASPRYPLTSSTAGYENLLPRRHKHKVNSDFPVFILPFHISIFFQVKHKKKHREDRKQQREETYPTKSSVSPEEETTEDTTTTTDTYIKEIKERCLKQKLSINLKRLNASAYTRCEYSPESGSDEHGESAPDFPPPSQPLMMHITAQAVASGLGADGRRLGIGDVVWGKIHGFPWWPGKVLSITSAEGSPGAPQQAHVAWYGSSTSSLMPCDQLSPFLENFKVCSCVC